LPGRGGVAGDDGENYTQAFKARSSRFDLRIATPFYFVEHR